MREILFRGKRCDNGEWVYGSFVMDGTEFERRLQGKDEGLTSWGFIRFYDADSGRAHMYEVERDTVGQFTGILDLEEKKIFEGDLIDGWDATGQEQFKSYRVVWSALFGGWQAESLHSDDFDPLYCTTSNRYLVVGDIFDGVEI